MIHFARPSCTFWLVAICELGTPQHWEHGKRYTDQVAGMKSKKSSADNGAERLATIVEAHLDQLPSADRAEKIRAFHEVVAKIGNRAKSGESRSSAVNRPATLKRA
jgi:hypothetical protein